MKVIIERSKWVGKENVISLLFYPIALYFFLLLLTEAFWRLYSYLNDIVFLPELRQQVVADFFEAINRKNYHFHQVHARGTLVHSAINLSKTVGELVTLLFFRFFSAFFMTFFSLFILYRTHPLLGLFLGTNFVLALFFLYRWRHVLRKDAMVLAQKRAEISGHMTDTWQHIFLVFLYSAQSHEEGQLKAKLIEGKSLDRRLHWRYFFLFMLISFLFMLMFFLSIVLLFYLYKKDQISIGDFGLVFGTQSHLIRSFWWNILPLSELPSKWGEVAQALSLMEADFPSHRLGQKGELKVSAGRIDFEGIDFHHKEGQPHFFSNFSLSIKAGEKVALVGYSGGGKSTLVKLLAGFYPLEKGKISIDGQDISTIAPKSLAKSMAFLSQDALLFNRSLWANLVYGLDPIPSRKAVDQVLKSLHLEALVRRLPLGYQTLVEEGSTTLSGGERQRMGIARVMLKNAPILILDEATSQLDNQTDASIQVALQSIMKGKTVIIIAHKLTHVVEADRIIFLKKGVISEEGTHNQLLEKGGHYATFWAYHVAQSS